MLMQWTEQEPDVILHDFSSRIAGMPVLELVSLLAISFEEPGVCIEQAAWQCLNEHLASEGIEMGGLLLGNVYMDASAFEVPQPRLIEVTHTVGAKHFSGTAVSLEMGTGVWDDARPLLDEGLAVVGWYHSHPNLGAFFSGTDRKTQRALFREQYHLGLVVDPVRNEWRLFRGPESVEIGSAQICFSS
jgi:proteasome lid subunit RPN8/RPN11